MNMKLIQELQRIFREKQYISIELVFEDGQVQTISRTDKIKKVNGLLTIETVSESGKYKVVKYLPETEILRLNVIYPIEKRRLK